MNRSELSELHNITLIESVPSILRLGVLSYARAAAVDHRSVAMPEIQQVRDTVVVPGGRPLHQYANLYMNARNKTLFKVKSQCGDTDMCILRVGTAVLDLPGVVIADQNARSKYVRFSPSPAGLQRIVHEMLFAESWKHPDDQIAEWRHGSVMCAEVLVPDWVDPQYIMGAYVSCNESLQRFRTLAPDITVDVNEHLFFR